MCGCLGTLGSKLKQRLGLRGEEDEKISLWTIEALVPIARRALLS